MKKKRIRYSELASPPASAPRPAAAASDMPPPAPVAETRTAVPLELARALAAARAAESPPAAPVPRATPVKSIPAVAATRAFRERARARSGSVELLVFRVASERFGVELAAVEEAIDLPAVHHVPEMPPAMLGVITVRGALTPVYSPEAALGLPLTSGESALVFRRGRTRVALVIDDVDDVLPFDLSLLRDAPGLDASSGILLGVTRHGDALLALVDAESLLSACSAAPILETA